MIKQWDSKKNTGKNEIINQELTILQYITSIDRRENGGK